MVFISVGYITTGSRPTSSDPGDVLTVYENVAHMFIGLQGERQTFSTRF